jgi:hypothetical protein
MNQWFSVTTKMQIYLHQPTDTGERKTRKEKLKKNSINISDILL